MPLYALAGLVLFAFQAGAFTMVLLGRSGWWIGPPAGPDPGKCRRPLRCMSRIEGAALRERVRILERIAAGIDI